MASADADWAPASTSSATALVIADDETADSLLSRYLLGEVSFEQYTAASSRPRPRSSADVTRPPSADAHRQLLSSETADLIANYTDLILGSTRDEEAPADDDAAPSDASTSEETDAAALDDSDDADYEPEGADTSRRRRPSPRRKPQTTAERRGPLPEEAADDEQLERELLGGGVRGAATRRLRTLPDALMSLLGEANVSHARGNSQQAVEMILEIVRQVPRNPEPYGHLSAIYMDLNQAQKSHQYALFAAHLDYKTPSAVWADLGEQAQAFGQTQRAIACFGKAIHESPTDWKNYEAKIRLLEAEGAESRVLELYLRAVAALRDSEDFAFFRGLATDVASRCETAGRDAAAVLALTSLLHRAANEQVLLFDVLEQTVSLMLRMEAFQNAAETIIRYGNVQQTSGDEVLPLLESSEFLNVKGFVFNGEVPLAIRMQLAISLLHLNHVDLSDGLIADIRQSFGDDVIGGSFVDLAKAYAACGRHGQVVTLLNSLIERPSFGERAEMWLLYAEALSAERKLEEACTAFGRAVALAPADVDARVGLAALQQQLGLHDDALDTLQQLHDEAAESLVDERILARQVDMLHSRKDWHAFLRSARMLVAPYFYDVYRVEENPIRFRRNAPTSGSVSVPLRRSTHDVLQGSSFEKFVVRVGAKSDGGVRRLNAQALHDVCFKMCEVQFELGLYRDLLLTCCYAYVQPLLATSGLSTSFHAILLLAAVRARQWRVAFEYLRTSAPTDDRPRRWNAFGLIFAMSQDVAYHRCILRLTVKWPHTVGLSILNGTNSLVAGSYSHALSEYISMLHHMPTDPLLNLLTAVAFLHLACKKDVSRRHDLCIQAFAFLKQYETARGVCQETAYNIGRAMHQANILYVAIHYYKRVLRLEPLCADAAAAEQAQSTASSAWDLRPLAAHNLSLIYKLSGNSQLAQQILADYCVF